jgi:tetratricopeptide (TPR) repeat protein
MLAHSLKRLFLALFLTATMALAGTAQAQSASMDQDVSRIAHEWARIRYRVTNRSQQYHQLDTLADQAAAIAARYPSAAEPLLWQGIVTSEEAARAGTFSQLGLAREARRILERAQEINPRAGRGGVPMSLGVLYYKVPGWPIGFGSSTRARQLLQQALAQNPNGLDANFFYADFLESEGDHAGARTYANRALQAPHDASRPIWDAGRRAETRDLLVQINRHLH